jgi:hypothetical protein
LIDIDGEVAPVSLVPYQAPAANFSPQPIAFGPVKPAGSPEKSEAAFASKVRLAEEDWADALLPARSGNEEVFPDKGALSSVPLTLSSQDLIRQAEPMGWEVEAVTDQMGQMQLDRLIETLVDRLERAYLRTYGTSGR